MGARPRFREEEGVVHVASRVLLGLEEGVEIPERRLHEVVGGHFGEAHFEENLAVLGSDFEQWVKRAVLHRFAKRIEIELLEGLGGPRTIQQHLCRQIRLGLHDRQSEVLALADVQALDCLLRNEIALGQGRNVDGGGVGLGIGNQDLKPVSHEILNGVDIALDVVSVLDDPLLLHGLAEANLCLRTQGNVFWLFLEFCERNGARDEAEHASFMRALRGNLAAFIRHNDEIGCNGFAGDQICVALEALREANDGVVGNREGDSNLLGVQRPLLRQQGKHCFRLRHLCKSRRTNKAPNPSASQVNAWQGYSWPTASAADACGSSGMMMFCGGARGAWRTTWTAQGVLVVWCTWSCAESAAPIKRPLPHRMASLQAARSCVAASSLLGARALHITAIQLAGQKVRLNRGQARSGTEYGPLTDLPDWSYTDAKENDTRPQQREDAHFSRVFQQQSAFARIGQLLVRVNAAKKQAPK
eukprot:m.716109 g.716109  ORF g.716109 m.716109 type:complete len:473 (+) comp58794_c0_seq2:749-2167(+)